ncbi:MAG TPA: hypothetical protein VJ698_22040 [Noviherbaspirillum sp.]|uniref:hypothetical protein n=1 Tax=Noviherbaspirillum sp. TaxID=1926288 RepID=UPI002B487AE3|nr:hypothetical protein [Noviherbaspirillum sp.]HJV88167.1 hypothetical protein [Noviherbaspirillum sp.]
MEKFRDFDDTLLNSVGLNRYAIFDIDKLPAKIAAEVRAQSTSGLACRQLILIGHAGRKLWESVTAEGIRSAHPIDDFTVRTVRRWFEQCLPKNTYKILYPGTQTIGLQGLGQLAGWHHASPFMVGIDQAWGTWYAYRALVLADTAFEPSQPVQSDHPCTTCNHTRCVTNCPAAAFDAEKFELAKCIAYRKQDGSGCKATCLARVSCPVGSAHRYCDEQIRHTYLGSMRAIERYY